MLNESILHTSTWYMLFVWKMPCSTYSTLIYCFTIGLPWTGSPPAHLIYLQVSWRIQKCWNWLADLIILSILKYWQPQDLATQHFPSFQFKESFILSHLKTDNSIITKVTKQTQSAHSLRSPLHHTQPGLA